MSTSENPTKNKSQSTNQVNKEAVMAAIVECAEKLGRTPSQSEVMRTGQVTRRQIRKFFGTYVRSLHACGLEKSGHKLEIEELFRDWAKVTRTLKKLPSITDYELLGKYSTAALTGRFDAWTRVPAGMKRLAEERGWVEKWSDVMEIVATQKPQGPGGKIPMPESPVNRPRVLMDRPLYGPLMRPYPLIHGPINEAGVIYLFGTLSEKLGYVVLRIQNEFPDCEAMRLVDEDHWQRVRIEFEYESRNFLAHRHAVSECDVIVCWRHNWPDCPLEVVELKREIAKIAEIGNS
jgi:hypothetical protein